jgi:phosphate transport system substrate-binding protein
VLEPIACGESPITIKGAVTFGEVLGPALVEAYHKEFPQVPITIESKGSISGVRALLDHQCDIASSSRPVDEDASRLAQSRGIKLHEYIIGFYGIAVVVNKTNPVRRVTDRQVRDIFSGAITNWKAVGGNDAPIQVYSRDPIPGLAFTELAMGGKPYTASAKTFPRYGEIVQAVKDDENGIGYSSLISPDETALTTLGINGIKLTARPVQDGEYPYSRTLRLVTEGYRESPQTNHFINFILSPAGQKVLARVGFIPRRLGEEQARLRQ